MASSGTTLWNVASQDLFEDLEPDETNTAFRTSKDIDSLSQVSGSMPGSCYQSESGASSVGGDAPIPWGRELLWYMNMPHSPSPTPDSGSGAPLWTAASGPPPGLEGPPSASSRDPQREPPPKGGPGSPMVLWCEATPTHEVQAMEALEGYYGSYRPQVVHFWSPARFTRWLFGQPRGEVEPWALLIVGWREAKPSAMAIAAARSGDTSALRPDARCPQLQPLQGKPAEVQVAVEAMIIMLEKPEHHDRVAAWAKDGGRQLAGMEIHVASDAATLAQAVKNLRAARDRKPQVLHL